MIGHDPSFGVGIDCEDVARWQALLNATGPRSIDALFSTDEHKRCRDRTDSAQRYAGLGCAKEATVKAVAPFARITPRDVRVTHLPDGRPIAQVPAPVADGLQIQVSISHTDVTAMAYALAVRNAAL